MIAANYTADFYCDGCHSGHLREADYYDENTLEITGQTWGDCLRAARKHGWKVSRDRRYCLCPLCIADGIKLTHVQEAE